MSRATETDALLVAVTDTCFVIMLCYCPTRCLTSEKEEGNKGNDGIDMLQNDAIKYFSIVLVSDIKIFMIMLWS